MNEWMNGYVIWMDGWMNEWMDGYVIWMDGWMDGSLSMSYFFLVIFVSVSSITIT